MKKVIKIKAPNKKVYKELKTLLKCNHIKFKKKKNDKQVKFKYNRKFEDIIKIVEHMNCKVKFVNYVHNKQTSTWCSSNQMELQMALRYFTDNLDDIHLSEDEFNKVDEYLKLVA